MEFIRQQGLEIVRAFQTIPGLDIPMRILSIFGDEIIYFAVVPLLYWCFSKTVGIRFLVILLLSNAVNHIAKVLLHEPRPYWVDSSINTPLHENSYGLPSGHAQNALAVWGYLATVLKNHGMKFAYLIFGLFILGIAISRLYIGVHFPQDTVLGLIVGGITLVLFIKYWTRVEKAYINASFSWKIIGTLLFTGGLILLAILSNIVVSGIEDPAEWQTNAKIALGMTVTEDLRFEPRTLEWVFTNAGTFAGLGIGLALSTKTGSFSIEGTILEKILRMLIGLIGVFAVRFGLGAVFPSEDIEGFIFRYIRYALILIWAIWLAPIVFVKIKIARPAETGY